MPRVASELQGITHYVKSEPMNFKKEAIGDGATDELGAFNRASRAMAAGEFRTLYVPCGDYALSAAPDPITTPGVAIYGDGKRQSLFKPQGAFNGFWVKATDPLTDRISDVRLSGFGVDYLGATAPSAGTALRLSRPDHGHFDVGVYNCFQGLLLEGGANCEFESTRLFASGTWPSLATNSWLLRVTNYPGSLEVPSEMDFDLINMKGSSTAFGAPNYLEWAVRIECGDGLKFGPGHSGFGHAGQWWINPQTGPVGYENQLSLQNVVLLGHYIDGNGAGDTAGSAFKISGSTDPVCRIIKLIGCEVQNFDGRGVFSDLSTVEMLHISGGTSALLGEEHVRIEDAMSFTIANMMARDGNNNNSGADAVRVDSCGAGVIVGNTIMAGAHTHPNGLHVISSPNVTRGTNTLLGHTAAELIV